MLMEIKKCNSLSNNETIYELSDNGQIVGGAKVEIINDVLLLKALYIKPEERQKKFGTYLLNHIENDNKDNISRIESDLLFFSDIGFENLINFYEKSGYEYNIFKMVKKISNES